MRESGGLLRFREAHFPTLDTGGRDLKLRAGGVSEGQETLRTADLEIGATGDRRFSKSVLLEVGATGRTGYPITAARAARSSANCWAVGMGVSSRPANMFRNKTISSSWIRPLDDRISLLLS